MPDFEAKLSEEIQKYEHLYNSSSKDQKDRNRVNNSWKEIPKTLQIDTDTVHGWIKW